MRKPEDETAGVLCEEVHYDGRRMLCYADRPASLNAMFDGLVGRCPQRPAIVEDGAISYAELDRLARIIGAFTLIAILISCLGLFGLSAFAAEQRTKEVGIRKVLGASVAGIVALLSKDFLKLVLIALVFASPLAYWFMEKWLDNFAYRINIQWWVFALAGAIAVVVAFLTVSFQSVKAALANPVEALRSE